VALIAFDASDAFVAMPHGSGIYVRRLLAAIERLRPEGLMPVARGGRGPEVVWEQVRLPRLLRARGADLVHSPDSFLPLRRPCPGVVTIHDLAFEQIPGEMRARTAWKYRIFVRRSAYSAERVICPSLFTVQDLRARYGVAPEKIRVIPEAPALEATGELPPPAGPYILAVGDLRPKKNLPRLIEAYRLLRREGLRHRLVLAGADLGVGARLAQMAGGEPLELPGFVGDEQLDALLRGAEALILPSLYEGFGLVVLDAMARGCPTVLARAGALPETGGDAASYFDPLDPLDLAAAVRRVLCDRGLRESLREAGLARVREFSWERTAAQTLAVYEELL
jgi:glycosyltransferase involved in cell wall biosynthesis